MKKMPFNPWGVPQEDIIVWYDMPQIVVETVYGQKYMAFAVEDNIYYYFPTTDKWIQELTNHQITFYEICMRGIDRVIGVDLDENFYWHVPREEITDEYLPAKDSYW